MSSVKASDRKPNKFDVFLYTRKLCIYTLSVTANEKIFTPKYYEAITRKLNELALAIHSDCWRANNIVVNNQEDYAERHRLQASAITNCQVFLSLLDVAAGLFHLRSKRVLFWTEMITGTRNLIRGWRDSDAGRYRKGM